MRTGPDWGDEGIWDVNRGGGCCGARAGDERNLSAGDGYIGAIWNDVFQSQH